MNKDRFTHIVVGAGAAGCAVANRLSADPAARVLLLEAGGPDRNPLIHMPAGFTKLTSPSINWRFSTVPQTQLNNREMYYPQGRTLGGSTSINPARARPNLSVLTHATATRVFVSRGRAIGLAYLHDKREHVAYADGGIVLSGGAVNSPKLLLLSGIGPADELRAHGMDVVHD